MDAIGQDLYGIFWNLAMLLKGKRPILDSTVIVAFVMGNSCLKIRLVLKESVLDLLRFQKSSTNIVDLYNIVQIWILSSFALVFFLGIIYLDFYEHGFD